MWQGRCQEGSWVDLIIKGINGSIRYCIAISWDIGTCLVIMVIARCVHGVIDVHISPIDIHIHC